MSEEKKSNFASDQNRLSPNPDPFPAPGFDLLPSDFEYEFMDEEDGEEEVTSEDEDMPQLAEPGPFNIEFDSNPELELHNMLYKMTQLSESKEGIFISEENFNYFIKLISYINLNATDKNDNTATLLFTKILNNKMPMSMVQGKVNYAIAAFKLLLIQEAENSIRQLAHKNEFYRKQVRTYLSCKEIFVAFMNKIPEEIKDNDYREVLDFFQTGEVEDTTHTDWSKFLTNSSIFLPTKTIFCNFVLELLKKKVLQLSKLKQNLTLFYPTSREISFKKHYRPISTLIQPDSKGIAPILIFRTQEEHHVSDLNKWTLEFIGCDSRSIAYFEQLMMPPLGPNLNDIYLSLISSRKYDWLPDSVSIKVYLKQKELSRNTEDLNLRQRFEILSQETLFKILYNSAKTGEFRNLEFAINELHSLELTLDAPDSTGKTALTLVIIHEHCAAVKLLLEKGATIMEESDEDINLNETNSFHRAIETGNLKIISLLLTHAANEPEFFQRLMQSKDDRGRTAMDIANELNNPTIIELLKNPTKATTFNEQKESQAPVSMDPPSFYRDLYNERRKLFPSQQSGALSLLPLPEQKTSVQVQPSKDRFFPSLPQDSQPRKKNQKRKQYDREDDSFGSSIVKKRG